ncbi:DUF3558 domain-containing protein [Amycolatopsis anabasis]|uniref:DUF3558 domain-containing protein n=1 Tax=Amycolatopsis anabasis TaxID=1840409 RepID=UPI001C5539C9|nr:DUF3558 domain-containing protein [Amycolatopsis anabasis]
MIRLRTLAALAAVGVVLAGCSDTKDGTPSPASPAGQSSGADPGTGVPPVETPLDTARFEQDPCSLLTSAQAQEIAGLVKSTPDNAQGGPSCQWQDPSGFGINIGFIPNGLRNLYSQHKAGRVSYFEPVASVAGYPGAFGALGDVRAQGTCTLSVGVRNDLAMSVVSTLGSQRGAQSCQVVLKAAETAVTTIKGGA